MFMRPILENIPAWHVETTDGTVIVPQDLVGGEPSLADFEEFCEGDPESFERRDGWLHYFSAPGYMDRTDYGHAATKAEAVGALLEDADEEQTDEILRMVGLDPEAFLESYLECALWSSTDEQEDGNGGPPLDDTYGPEDFDPEARASAETDCRNFMASNWTVLVRLAEEADYSAEQAGHDFWLTRNRHGAGFWDRGLGDDGKTLTDAAHVYGSVDLCAHEGKVHGS